MYIIIVSNHHEHCNYVYGKIILLFGIGEYHGNLNDQ